MGKDVGKEAEKGGRSRMRMGFEGQAGRNRQVLPETKGLFNPSMLLLLMSLGVCDSGVQESDVWSEVGADRGRGARWLHFHFAPSQQHTRHPRPGKAQNAESFNKESRLEGLGVQKTGKREKMQNLSHNMFAFLVTPRNVPAQSTASKTGQCYDTATRASLFGWSRRRPQQTGGWAAGRCRPTF